MTAPRTMDPSVEGSLCKGASTCGAWTGCAALAAVGALRPFHPKLVQCVIVNPPRACFACFYSSMGAEFAALNRYDSFLMTIRKMMKTLEMSYL
jgi:hypothetical protein